MYFIGRGEILTADRNADGTHGALEDAGEVDMFEFSINAEFAQNFNTKRAVSRQDLHVVSKETAEGTMNFKEATAKNLEFFLFGTKVDPAPEVLVDVPFPAGIVVGQTLQVPGGYVNLSDLSIEDNAAAPLVEGTHYTVDLVYGLVKFINLGALEQPFKISCDAAGATDVAILTKRSKEKFIFFKGINIADGDKPVVVELYRGAFAPASKITLKDANGNSVAGYEMKFNILEDGTKPDAGPMGQFGRYRLL